MLEARVMTLRGIPVALSIWFLVPVLLSIGAVPSVAGELALIASWFLSVVLHELGHGLVAKRHGLAPSIVLHGFGGYCIHRQAPSARADLAITAAGPAVSLALAAVFFGVRTALHAGASDLLASLPALSLFVESMLWMNLAWGLFNLLPIRPLDGGELTNVLVRERQPRAKAHKTVRTLGLAVAAVGFLALVLIPNPYRFLPFLLAYLAYINYQALQGPPEPGTRYAAQAHGGASWAARSRGGTVARPVLRVLPVTRTLVAVMVGIWAFFLAAGVWAEQRWAADAYAWLMLTPGEALTQPWTLATYAWLHATDSLGHVFTNSLFLVLLGSMLEERWGGKAYLRFFLLCTLGAGVVSALLGLASPSVFGAPMVGASGGTVGLLVAMGLVMGERQVLVLLTTPVKLKWVVWAALALDTLAFLLVPERDVAWQGHMGGALTAWLLVTGNWRPGLARDRVKLARVRNKRAKLQVIDGGRSSSGDRLLN